MTDPKKETVWITIPDEATSVATNTPVLDALSKEVKKEPSDKVKNRAFWGGGFVVLVAFVSLLLAPQEFASLMQGNLFDGTFQVIPEYEEQKVGTLFGEGEEEEEAEADEEFEDEIVVEAESEAVSIQIEPLADVEGEDVAEEAEPTGDAEVVTEAETIVIDAADGVEAEAEVAEDGEELDANAKLLQSLSKQLEEFKEEERRNEQLIQDLMQLLADQAAGVRPAAPLSGAQVTPGLLPEGQVDQFGQPIVQPTAQFGVGVGAGVYRYNTHTVTISPYDILAQNQAAQTQQAAAYQASLPYGAVQPYAQPAYAPVFADVPVQPDTGPTETFLFALLLASFGVLVWGSVRAIKA